MPIVWNEKDRIFHLSNSRMSYLIQIVHGKYPAHLYWGRHIQVQQPSSILTFKGRAFSPTTESGDKNFSLDTLPQEYPAFGNGDFRNPAYQLRAPDGSTITEFVYDSHEIFQGKRHLKGLPASYVEKDSEADTLVITMVDSMLGVGMNISYTIYREFDLITRSVSFENRGNEDVEILKCMSMSVDFHESDWEWLHLHGTWGRERHIERQPLHHGVQMISSARGASSHRHNPFVALLSKNASEEHGDVYGISLVYSGNFQASIEVDPFEITRLSIGMNPFDFSWRLKPGEFFQTPEALMVYSAEGLGGMSRTFHKLLRSRVCRGVYRDKVRPILINNWEATYFHFSEKKLKDIADAGKDLGIELFVLDDGWFGRRDNDKSSLGDWGVYQKKLPHGLKGLSEYVRKKGMHFGLWVEPEMVSPDSDLYRKHPDWCLHVPGRHRTKSRNQLVLDLSRDDVCDFLIDTFTKVFSSAAISYVKWDMNRNMTEVGSAILPPDRQKETAHRYMLGLYRILDTLTERFPSILFESCSGGGGRFDPGMLYYMPQTWTSDDTDAVERLKIQYGTSLVYPAIAMSAHVSDVPNHQVGRTTPMLMRCHVAMAANLGFELNIDKLSHDDKKVVKEKIHQYHQLKEMVCFGDFFRLLSPFSGMDTAWMYVAPDQEQAVVFYYKILATPNPPFLRLKLRGLNPKKLYNINNGEQPFFGDELIQIGLALPLIKNDFTTLIFHIKGCQAP
ncbi:alpha-galactosidase [Neobacillus massiliamazoniensis]|uniref:Alpha-galactosidase n=1 Tax=Neobacillus massiliamazoniensis TaxID=1499688 RepID=A0A0U1NWD1_9BACI|nr:alpha-galactosidase [Neobacillus massiliamazoniensis]CRK82320.1 glycoside hydrolase clan GH-D [Neobacillus massiliamazoniensis]